MRRRYARVNRPHHEDVGHLRRRRLHPRTPYPVWVLEGYRRLGRNDAELLGDYPSLTASDLKAAWEYAAAHAEEIDLAIRNNEEGEEGLVE